jgi:hypothetical protein
VDVEDHPGQAHQKDDGDGQKHRYPHLPTDERSDDADQRDDADE